MYVCILGCLEAVAGSVSVGHAACVGASVAEVAVSVELGRIIVVLAAGAFAVVGELAVADEDVVVVTSVGVLRRWKAWYLNGLRD